MAFLRDEIVVVFVKVMGSPHQLTALHKSMTLLSLGKKGKRPSYFFLYAGSVDFGFSSYPVIHGLKALRGCPQRHHLLHNTS